MKIITINLKTNFSTDDNLSDVEDVEWALEQLPNVVERTKYDGWDHLGNWPKYLSPRNQILSTSLVIGSARLHFCLTGQILKKSV